VPGKPRSWPTSTPQGFQRRTEAINLSIEKVRRLAHGFKDFDHYRLRIMLAAADGVHTELRPPMLKSEEPLNGTLRQARELLTLDL
jgi:hypothetical protein